MKKYIEQEAAIALSKEIVVPQASGADYKHRCIDPQDIRELPAADVVEVRQIRAFIDRLVAERDKYDLHSMRWEHYDCDRLLIEQMLDEMDGGVNDGRD